MEKNLLISIAKNLDNLRWSGNPILYLDDARYRGGNSSTFDFINRILYNAVCLFKLNTVIFCLIFVS